MAESTIWWVLAGSVVAVELVTGTFYLLMLSFGMVAAALVAHAGATTAIQILVAALCGGGSVVFWWYYKKIHAAKVSARAKPNTNLDVGEVVQVEAWSTAGTSSVKYRGAMWSVSLAHGDSPLPGAHRIVEMIGSRLIVKKI